jgi:hypothetical protein
MAIIIFSYDRLRYNMGIDHTFMKPPKCSTWNNLTLKTSLG